MGVVFNADEILKIAERIEENGVVFYKKAMDLFSDEHSRDILESLANMELAHKKVFSDMRKGLTEEEKSQTSFDPEGLADEYLKAFADGYVFPIDKGPEEIFKGDESLSDVIDIAIQREKDSIVFYLGLKDIVPPRLGKDKIDGIIREEMSHITILSNLKAHLKG